MDYSIAIDESLRSNGVGVSPEDIFHLRYHDCAYLMNFVVEIHRMQDANRPFSAVSRACWASYGIAVKSGVRFHRVGKTHQMLIIVCKNNGIGFYPSQVPVGRITIQQWPVAIIRNHKGMFCWRRVAHVGGL